MTGKSSGDFTSSVQISSFDGDMVISLFCQVAMMVFERFICFFRNKVEGSTLKEDFDGQLDEDIEEDGDIKIDIKD
jgi:hypothetical protein